MPKSFRKEAKALLRKISPYPWTYSHSPLKYSLYSNDGHEVLNTIEHWGCEQPVGSDPEFIAKAPELIEQYEKKLAEAEEVLSKIHKFGMDSHCVGLDHDKECSGCRVIGMIEKYFKGGERWN